MGLQGSVESFGISEIFELISHQQKTGTLEIETQEGLARLRFQEGRLIEAWPDRRSPGEMIGALLVRAGLITPVQLGHALQSQKESLRKLGDILTRMGALRVADFRDVLALQHRETVYRLLALKRGTYRFLPEPVEGEEGISVPMEVGGLLMEGFRQIDEWPRLREVVPSERQVYTRTSAPVPGDLTTEESRVLALVDGNATVRTIVDRARVGEFGGWEALAGLVQRKLIAPVGVGKIIRASLPRRQGRWLDAAVALVLVGAACGLVLLSLSWRAPLLSRWEQALRGARAESQRVEEEARAWAARFHGDPLPALLGDRGRGGE